MAGGNLYTLVITESSAGRAYAPQVGDAFELIIYSDPVKKSSGSVTEVSGETFTLMPAGAEEAFTATVSAGALSDITGKITLEGGGTQTAPGPVAALLSYSGSAGGVSYTLTLPKTPAVGDPYTLALSGAVTKNSTGTISAVAGTAFTLKPASYPPITFSVKITGNTPQLLGLIHCTDETPLAAGPDAIQTLVPMNIPEELWGVWEDYDEGNGDTYLCIFTPTVWAMGMESMPDVYGFVEGATFTPRNGVPDNDVDDPDNEFIEALYTVSGGIIKKANQSGTGYDEYFGEPADPGVWYFSYDKTKYAVNDDEGKAHTKK